MSGLKKSVTWRNDVIGEPTSECNPNHPRNIPAECMHRVIAESSRKFRFSHLKRYKGFASDCRQHAAHQRRIFRDLRIKMASEPMHTRKTYDHLARIAASREREFVEEARMFEGLALK